MDSVGVHPVKDDIRMTDQAGKRHVTWAEAADNLLATNWGESSISPRELLKYATDSRIHTVLLLDIAQSLRVLRCQNFQNIPFKLDQIVKQTRKRRRRAKKR